jgi:hypothetical protein
MMMMMKTNEERNKKKIWPGHAEKQNSDHIFVPHKTGTTYDTVHTHFN